MSNKLSKRKPRKSDSLPKGVRAAMKRDYVDKVKSRQGSAELRKKGFNSLEQYIAAGSPYGEPPAHGTKSKVTGRQRSSGLQWVQRQEKMRGAAKEKAQAHINNTENKKPKPSPGSRKDD